MKATGIVRRIDDLGRVVIPKEIRRTMRIREGDPLEIYTSGSGEVIFKKYSPVGEMGEYANLLCFAAARQTEYSIAICDRDHCIASAGAGAKDMLSLSVGGELEAIMEARKAREFAPEESVSAFSDSGYNMGLAVPIIASGDIAGAVVFIRNSGSGEIGKSELSLANCISAFISRQLEM